MKIKSKKLIKGILIAEVTLSMTRCAYGFEDTLYKMFEQTDIAQHIYLGKDWKNVDVTKIIEQSLECSDNIRKIFEEIAQDEVGRLTLRAFYQGQKIFGKKLRVIEDRAYINKNGDAQTNTFAHEDFAIYLDLTQLNDVTTVGYCNGGIFEKRETAINILFHEFVHAVHYVMDDMKDLDEELLGHLYDDNPDRYYWTGGSVQDDENFPPDDEEIYTIDGLFLRDGQIQFNPICSVLFEANQQIKSGVKIKDISIRVLHCLFKDKPEDYISFDVLDRIESEVKTNLRKIFIDSSH